MIEVIGNKTDCRKCGSVSWEPNVSILDDGRIRIRITCEICQWQAFQSHAVLAKDANISYTD